MERLGYAWIKKNHSIFILGSKEDSQNSRRIIFD